MNAYLEELLLYQLGISRPKKRVERPVEVEKAIDAAGYCSYIPTDNTPVSQLPGMIRLSKEAWLRNISVEASFRSDVEDGMLVTPVANTVSDLYSENLAQRRDVTWIPFNKVKNTDSYPQLFGIAYKYSGRVVFGPLVFHRDYAFNTGTLIYAGDSGKIVTEGEFLIGICPAPGYIILSFDMANVVRVKTLEDKITSLEERIASLEAN